MERLSLMMAGAQRGITVCSLASGSLSEPVTAHLVEPGFEVLWLPRALVHPSASAGALPVRGAGPGELVGQIRDELAIAREPLRSAT